MPRFPSRLPVQALALSCLLLVLACDSTGVTPTETEATKFDGVDIVEGAEAAHRYRPNRHHSPSPVVAFPDGVEPFGSSLLVRRQNSVRFRIETSHLAPGHAYTLWMVIFNNPEGCAADDGEAACNDFDLFNPEARPDMVYAAGRRVGRSGATTFVGQRRVGSTMGSVNEPVGVPAYGLMNPMTADIRFIIHDHGPIHRDFLPDMVRSIDGGCIDAGVPFEGFASPWNLYDGPVQLPAYGRRGPNTCQSVQVAVHLPE